MAGTDTNLEDQIRISFENIIKVYTESSMLLLDASQIILKDKDYKDLAYICPHGNTLGTNQSKNINYPADWITPYGARYFSSEKYPKTLLGICIIYIGPENTPVNPIIVYGKFNMKENIRDNYEYNYLRHSWYHLIKNRDLEIPHSVVPTPDLFFKSGIIVGVALTKLKNLKCVKDEIVSPLMNLLEK